MIRVTLSILMIVEMFAVSNDLTLVIFDCDGTLVDSQHVIANAMRMAFREAGLAEPQDHEVRNIIGLSLDQAVGALAPEAHPVEPLREAYKAAFIRQRQQPGFHEPLFSGARDILHELSQMDHVLLGVATGKSRRGVDVLFEREQLADYFVAVQTADDAPSKPHPGMIENAMRQTGVSPHNVLMVGDTTYDIEMARNAGVGAIGVRWGYHEDERLEQAGAHRMIDEFGDLHDLLPRISDIIQGRALA
jgi:phosphoglycolate phosphatase